jgi:hypothetical protein
VIGLTCKLFTCRLLIVAQPTSLTGSGLGGENHDAYFNDSRKRSTSGSTDSSFDSIRSSGQIHETVRRQRRKEQNRAA